MGLKILMSAFRIFGTIPPHTTKNAIKNDGVFYFLSIKVRVSNAYNRYYFFFHNSTCTSSTITGRLLGFHTLTFNKSPASLNLCGARTKK